MSQNRYKLRVRPARPAGVSGSDLSGPSPDRTATVLVPCIAAVTALLVYVRTLTPGMQVGDGTEFAAMAHVLGVPHPTGYPLYMLLLKLWLMITIGGEVILRTTLFNGVCMAVAVGVLTNLLFGAITSAWPSWPAKVRILSAAAGGLGTGFLRLHWSSAVVTEVYALEFLLMVGFLRAVQHWTVTKRGAAFLWMALFLGLGLAHHRISIFLVIPFVWAAWKFRSAADGRSGGAGKSWRPLLSGAVIICASLLLYLYLPLRGASAPLAWGQTTTVKGFLDHVRGTEYFFRSMLRAAPDRAFTPSTWMSFAGLQAQQFLSDAVTQMLPLQERLVHGRVVNRWFSSLTPGGALACLLLFGLAAVGFVRWWRTQRLVAGCAALVGMQNLLFLFIYNIPDIRDYTLFPLALVWWCALFGILVIADRPVQRSLLEGNEKVPQVLGYLLLLFPLFFTLGNWKYCDRSTDTVAEDISALFLPNSKELMPEGAILLTAGDSDTFTSWYRQHVRHERRDVLVYASNFIHMPWYRGFFTAEQKKRYSLGFADRVAYNPAEFVKQLESAVITPNLGKHPIFTSSQDVNVLSILASRYELLSVLRMPLPDEGTTLSLYRISPAKNRSAPQS